MPPNPLNNFKIQKYYQNEPAVNGLYLRNNLPKIKDWAYVINLDVYESITTFLVVLYVNGDNVNYLNNFRVEYISKEINKHIRNKNITRNIFWIQAQNSIMSG